MGVKTASEVFYDPYDVEPLDEVLNRFPEWNIDMSGADMTTTSTVRGWETSPAVLA